ncbi:VOC family protein [Faunimonas pinastri]|nr:VOC family protein [Faunimonas pinastri]
MIAPDRFDHLVLTVADIDRTVAFYSDALGMEAETRNGRTALKFGRQKINLHQRGHEFEPRALRPTPGSGDFCLIATTPLADVVAHLQDRGVAVELGPVDREGALGPMQSVYVRDPDTNLVEIAVYG